MSEFYDIPIDSSGLTANIVEMDAGGNMLIITEGPEDRDFATVRSWVQAEVFEFTNTMTLEQVMEKKKREERLKDA